MLQFLIYALDADSFFISNMINNNVKFLGRVPYTELHQYYRMASVIVVPSIWIEQFALVGIEAMQHGTPIVGTNMGGIPEWLHNNKNGFLVPPRNAKKLAQAVIKILNDRKLSKRFGEYSKRIVRKDYSMESHFKKLVDCYKKTIHSTQ